MCSGCPGVPRWDGETGKETMTAVGLAAPRQNPASGVRGHLRARPGVGRRLLGWRGGGGMGNGGAGEAGIPAMGNSMQGAGTLEKGRPLDKALFFAASVKITCGAPGPNS